MAARMESNGERNRIHCSQETARLIEQAGKHWACPRDTLVLAKGKGAVQTYWIDFTKRSSSNQSDTVESSNDDGSCASEHSTNQLDEPTGTNIVAEKKKRLVEWNTDVFCRLLNQVVARDYHTSRQQNCGQVSHESARDVCCVSVTNDQVDVIDFPESTAVHAAEAATLDPVVVQQVKSYIETICAMYSNNPFHNFMHASQVAMSVTKFLSRLAAPSDTLPEDCNNQESGQTMALDPLTQFACVFSALIHDMDVSGNTSLNLAWDLLMEPAFAEFRRVLCTNGECDLRCFRQMVVNFVLATDSTDAKQHLQSSQWIDAFGASSSSVDSQRINSEAFHLNKRAMTLVLAAVMQASDVSHTLQHWHIYEKWNERLFREAMVAYREGRGVSNPAESWYQSELCAFDESILPLVRKLKECNMFGVCADECLDYAIKNRAEWALRGHDIVAQMVEADSTQALVVSDGEQLVGGCEDKRKGSSTAVGDARESEEGGKFLEI